jgi:hypothetical protein
MLCQILAANYVILKVTIGSIELNLSLTSYGNHLNFVFHEVKSSIFYSFTPPMVRPETKYRCKNGYSATIGKQVKIVAAERMEVVVTCVLPVAVLVCAEILASPDN